MIAFVGHTCWHAVWTLSVGTCTLSVSLAFTFAAIFASWMRCTQNVHFSMTPRMRTVTFGFFESFSESGMPFSFTRFQRKYFCFVRSLKSKKLKRRTLNGQLFE